MDRRPLPRSLAPIPGESLSGYLLRLAHRLELAPRDVCEATGLVSRYTATVPNTILLTMDPAMARQLCDMTRLTTAEVSALTYQGLREVYPPANPTAFTSRGRNRARKLQVSESWLFLGATRYCPRCLAGDASEIQAAHGGGWNKLWRLPVCFACPTHRCFLSHLCPECANPAMANNPLYRSQIIPAPHMAGIHPSACRALVDGGTVCPGRFDAEQDPPPASNLTPDDVERLVDLQQRFLDLLTWPVPRAEMVRSAGRATTAAAYFTDLRITATLVTTALYESFPARVQSLDATTRQRHLHTEVRRYIAEDLRDNGPGARAMAARTLVGMRSPVPLDATACAALIGLTAEILAANDSADTIEMIKGLFGGTVPKNRIMSFYNWTSAGLPLSPGMRHVLDSARHRPPRVTTVGRARGRLQRFIPDLSDAPGLDANNVPQYLPRDWWTIHFTPDQGLSERWQRRLAAAVLAAALQHGTHRSVEEAAHLLGLPPPPLGAMKSVDPGRYRLSIIGLAQDLRGRSPNPDYARRRRFMQTWSLDDREWRDLTTGLPVKFGYHADVGEGKRHVSSLYIWTRVTQGDYLLAPRASLKSQGLKYMWARVKVPPPASHYIELVRRLDAYADDLGTRIDAVSDL